MARSLKSTRRLAAILLAVLAAACGYGFSSGVGRLPAGAERVFVPPFEDRTGDAEAGALVATALREELARRGSLGGPEAGARIEGAVIGSSANPASVGVNLNYQLVADVQARLVIAGKPASEVRVHRVEDYLGGRDPLESEGRRRLALRRAAAAIARELMERLEVP